MPPKKRRPGPKSKTQGVGAGDDDSPEDPQPGPSRRPGPKSKTQPGSPSKRPGPKSRTQPTSGSPEGASVATTISRNFYQCNQCSKRFREKRQLADHKRTDHPEYAQSLRSVPQSAATESVADGPRETERAQPTSPRRSPAKKRTRPDASTAHKTLQPDKSKVPPHKTKNRLPLAINNKKVSKNNEVARNPSNGGS